MVRVLSCYHFRGQKIGRCDEAAAVTVAGNFIVVGIEDSISVYNAGSTSFHDTLTNVGGIGGCGTVNQIPEIGQPIVFGDGDKSPLSPSEEKSGHQSGSCSSSVSSVESDTEIKMSHSFSTVELVRSLSYNRKGHYLLSLECTDSDEGNSKCTSIRVYFHWDIKHEDYVMRTRIAGVSPSVNDLEKPGLTMVEIPLTSPAISVASCMLTGHLASLSAGAVINVFSFRIKDASGRGKMQYYDFDRLFTVEIPGLSPEKISFLGNFISCDGPSKVHVFHIRKADKSWSPSLVTADKYNIGPPKTKAYFRGENGVGSRCGSPRVNLKSKLNFDHTNKVVYDPSDDSVTVHLPTITRANRKRAGNGTVIEEYCGEINFNNARMLYAPAVPGLYLEDVMRLSFPQSSSSTNIAVNDRFCATELYPVRINNKLGGVSCTVGMHKEAMVFHLPTQEKKQPLRIATYNFTAPLVSFTFDSMFFHALTESGLETYTSRSLYYALEDHEKFEPFINTCPLKAERPCLVGIRPFVRVRFMAANELHLCLLACPTSTETTNQQPPSSPTNPLLHDERLWTVYSLELPDVDMLYEDTMRLAKNQENNFETYFMLLCEMFLTMRTQITSCPEETAYYESRYFSLCKSIGLEYLKAAWRLRNESTDTGNPGALTQVNSSQNPFASITYDDLLDLGVTYLCMSKLEIQSVFGAENSMLLNDPQFIPGTVKLLDVLLSRFCIKDTNDRLNFSPALSSSIVDFISRYSQETLVDLVIRISFLRENQCTRLVEILQNLVIACDYSGKETLALILTYIAAGGVESNVRTQVKAVLDKVNLLDFELCLTLDFILDRSSKHCALTDVAICLTAVNSDLPTSIISDAVKRHEVSVSEVMLAFAKAVNLNSESQIQRSLARALRSVLEAYFAAKITNNNNNINEISQPVTKVEGLSFNDDERHAVQALVRSYISDITFSPTNKLIRCTTETANSADTTQSLDNMDISIEQVNSNTEKLHESEEVAFNPEAFNGTDIMTRNQVFGKIPSYVNYLLDVDSPGGSITPSNVMFSPSMFINYENMESYIRLLSLLSSVCGNVEGVKDLVLTFVYNNSASVTSTPLQLILLTFCEPIETAVSILISRQPTTVLLYAKEMFGKSSAKWKVLVTQLKKRINLNPNTTDSDMFSTIIESVYLHLANTLSLVELEEVLEKGSDDVAKFRSTCKRVELANSYANMVIKISSDYLENKQ